MSNIIALNAPPRRQRLSERTAALIECFARQRRIPDDVFWLKENAELLNILECTGQQLTQDDLEPQRAFYEELPERLGFFPQYYRFLLSIGLDLEDLGMEGVQMERLCTWTAAQGLPDAELSDLQRAEARRLLARRGVHMGAADLGLDDRLRAFINRPETFALPNKKAAYELTHIVFYLSEYGRCDPKLGTAALTSLEYAGILAYLDQNMDLLAEICVALRQAGRTPSAIWEGTVRANLSTFYVVADDQTPFADHYHEYLVSTWAMAVLGADDSGAALPVGRCLFRRPENLASALRPMSAALMSFGASRSGDWGKMEQGVLGLLEEDAACTLQATVASSAVYPQFFEAFARATRL
ncbi:hypothetical protein [uncultured Tateyamaria sp.]|uniref:DUF6902 family protein n=1 Tax=uncultured Tateyamaria sp. TaxID=455651 RepID=UPI00260DA3B1|nr:hypothetical protein [uncultured Tateyamaria sp.]